ncbi:MAG: ATP synthase F1 subunit gamma [Anaerolineaceae bacterium]|nr:ATP synthase F1 subunit gamma [Anaerolineaceae bacterium]
MRIRSVKNIAQVTKALETVSASKVRRTTQAVAATHPYAEKAWKVLLHLARQPGHHSLHPLLLERSEIKNILVVMVSGDRGLAGAYNVNIFRHTLQNCLNLPGPVSFVAVGRKGRDLLMRRHLKVIAEFSQLPIPFSYSDVSTVGRLVVDEFLNGNFDQVYLAYTEFRSMLQQKTVFRKLLPLKVEFAKDGKKSYNTSNQTNSVFTYEPGQDEILGEVIPRFTAWQVYEAILSSQASEHAARMVAMRQASDNARELISLLQLDYNKIRQQGITNDMLDIAGGAEALAQVES